MMTVQEAEKLLNIDLQNNKVDQVSETTNYYIFSVSSITTKNRLDRSFAPPIAVEKQTGKTLRFNPMMFSKDELKSIKRIR